MTERRSIWIRVVAAVLLVAALAATGFFIFRAGQASGMAILQSQSGIGQTNPALPAPFAFRGHIAPYGFGWHFFPPFGLFFLCIVPFLFFFLFGGLFRWAFWGRPWRHGFGPHYWHGQPPAGDPRYWQGQPPTGAPGQPAQPPAPDQPPSGQPPQQPQ